MNERRKGGREDEVDYIAIYLLVKVERKMNFNNFDFLVEYIKKKIKRRKGVLP